MVGDDRSDILSGDKLPVGRYQPPSYWSTLSGTTKVSSYFVTFLLFAVLGRTFYHRFLRWRETNYRKATRRKHGIPDTDNRPFNVAYAAAVTARKENEARKNLQLRQRTLGEASPAPSPARRSFGLDARQLTSVPGGLGSYPIRSPSVAGRARSSLGPTYGQQSHLYPINALNGRQDNISASSNRSNRSSPRKSSRPQTSSPAVHPRPLVDEDENSETEVVGQHVEENYFEDAPQSDEDHQMDIEGEGGVVPARGAKRLASPDDEDDFDDSFVTQRRDKRARKVSREHPPIPEDDVMVDAGAYVMDESHTSPRGKKRDRGDAASTFGGDGDALMDDSDGDHKRNRRRRTVSTRRPRGQKRGRESHAFESGSDEEVELSSTRGSRKKRGKKAVAQEDPSSFEPPYSTDPLCRGRRVGEEWEICGTKYKVGPNGDRLQQALVKRKRPKYKMPSDSQHPDKDVMIDVVVEAWLTEDEYKLAKERFELAWQDSPNVDDDIQTPSEPQTPVKGGKALLWSSTTSHADSPIPERRPFRHSITTNIGPPTPATPQIRTPGKGRISTPVYSPVAVGLDSPRLKHVKSFSKWEKQDMEAEAMSKIRQKLQETKKAAEDQKKPSPSPAPATTTTTPSFSTPVSAFSTHLKPGMGATTTTETKEPVKNPFAASTLPTTVPVPTPPVVPSLFTKPAPTTKLEPSATATNTIAPSFFSDPPVPSPSTTTTSNSTATPLPTFSFPTNQSRPTTTGTKSVFAFPGTGNTGSGSSLFPAPKPVEQPKQSQFNVTPTSTTSVPSLAARLGPQAMNTPAPAPSTTKPAPIPNPSGVTTTTSTGSVPEPPKPADNAPKFSFGFKPSTPATSSMSSTTPAQTTNTSTAPQFGKVGQSQPAPSPFGNTGQSQPTSSFLGNTNQSKPAPSSFGATNPSPSPFVITNQSQPAPSPFGATNNRSQPTPSSFGITNQSQPTTLPFGTTGQPNPPFGATNQGFGTQPTPSQPTSQPLFNFASNKPAGGPDPKAAFPSTNPTTGSSPGVFSLAAPKQDTSKPGPSPLRNGSVFGTTTTTPVSAFPTTTTTTTTPTPSTPAPAMDKPTFSFNFPNTPSTATTATNETTSSKPSQFMFTPVTPSTSTGGGVASPFNFAAMGQGQNNTTPAAFGFGAPNQGAFAFGKLEEKK
ncbi:hypothetical protein BJ322DRAFT_168367 [Thelephora terrestris]|uniref:Uncharacterized protein n=1 Tax=Thelephora terrestris TaxID=56493 RepID=A0A9P6HA84_9AGAM|nr:hypothetical protein BJ322DRAFT_168367 [Thelephora terrestris]